MSDRHLNAATALDMAARQRDISVSEFFLKNRHLLGFDTPAKALVTAVKEAVDNALDACEEARILPEIGIEVRDRYGKCRVIVEDNGPGIVENQIARIFGKLLYGSKFHKLSQSRGQQGMGISAAGMYAQLTLGKALAHHQPHQGREARAPSSMSRSTSPVTSPTSTARSRSNGTGRTAPASRWSWRATTRRARTRSRSI